jgi:mannose-6-phosphate isomerase-like protein (cupin superfamily)
MAFRGNIEKLTLKNTYYRKVIHTTSNMQLVLMSLKSGEEIGMEVHPHTSQFIRIESGRAMALIAGKRYYLRDGDAIIVPPNTKHNVINRGDDRLQLYSIYTPPEHPPDRKQRQKP